MADKIFVSYDYDNDRHYKNLLLAWNANDEFDLNFYDQSADVSVDSKDASYIKSVIKGRIENSSHFLCLIGKETSKSGWIKWEIDQAVALKKKIIAVKIDQSYSSPDNIFGVGASWAKSFSFDAITDAISNA